MQYRMMRSLQSAKRYRVQEEQMGNYHFEKRQHTHDDLVYALALACLAAREYGVKGVIIKI